MDAPERVAGRHHFDRRSGMRLWLHALPAIPVPLPASLVTEEPMNGFWFDVWALYPAIFLVLVGVGMIGWHYWTERH